MKTLFKSFAIIALFIFIGCEKDDFEEVVGLCPEVVLTNPDNETTGVPLDQIITASFNTRMDASTIHAETFTLEGVSPVSGIVSYSDSIATFRPVNSLEPNTRYTATINTLVKDITGNAIQTNYVWTFVTGPEGPNLNSVARFGVFAGAGIANTGSSVIRDMDVGVSTALRSTISGFPPAVVINGAIYAIDDVDPVGVAVMLAEAKSNLIAAYLFTENTTSPASSTISGDLGGRTLSPGIYRSNNNLLIQSGNLTLNARGDANAVFIFQVGGNLNTVGTGGGNIILSGGAQAKNIYWQLGNSASIGSGTIFHGNILALDSITLNSSSNVVGRLLARNGTISLNSNIINKP
ncbi:MAG: DUF3494 domain-containing protein [Saprospirales bacterium]|nr:MAG: DUF3494 domain-containing protein [Saprospirales bacterium]